jgi:hypothetical protein
MDVISLNDVRISKGGPYYLVKYDSQLDLRVTNDCITFGSIIPRHDSDRFDACFLANCIIAANLPIYNYNIILAPDWFMPEINPDLFIGSVFDGWLVSSMVNFTITDEKPPLIISMNAKFKKLYDQLSECKNFVSFLCSSNAQIKSLVSFVEFIVRVKYLKSRSGEITILSEEDANYKLTSPLLVNSFFESTKERPENLKEELNV